jgi:DNA-binding SARP family transcriptional activator
VIRFGLLGPAAAWQDGREVDLGSPQQRSLFALLLLHRGEVVSTDRMVDVLWPAGPPANAVEVLRTYVSRLRALGISELATHRQGYELRGEADADRFEALVAAGLAELDAAAAEEVQRIALRSYEALGCSGFARVDLVLAEDGASVLELNAIPGLTDTSLLPMAAEAAGLGFEQLVERIIALALERPADAATLPA